MAAVLSFSLYFFLWFIKKKKIAVEKTRCKHLLGLLLIACVLFMSRCWSSYKSKWDKNYPTNTMKIITISPSIFSSLSVNIFVWLCGIAFAGTNNYRDKYGEMIYRVQCTFGAPRKMEGPILDMIQNELASRIPPDQLNERRKWRDIRLASLQKLKNDLHKK